MTPENEAFTPADPNRVIPLGAGAVAALAAISAPVHRGYNRLAVALTGITATLALAACSGSTETAPAVTVTATVPSSDGTMSPEVGVTTTGDTPTKLEKISPDSFKFGTLWPDRKSSADKTINVVASDGYAFNVAANLFTPNMDAMQRPIPFFDESLGLMTAFLSLDPTTQSAEQDKLLKIMTPNPDRRQAVAKKMNDFRKYFVDNMKMQVPKDMANEPFHFVSFDIPRGPSTAQLGGLSSLGFMKDTLVSVQKDGVDVTRNQNMQLIFTVVWEKGYNQDLANPKPGTWIAVPKNALSFDYDVSENHLDGIGIADIDIDPANIPLQNGIPTDLLADPTNN